MSIRRSLAAQGLALLVMFAGPHDSVAAQHASGADAPPWTARHVEHLFNRAGFGATPSEVAVALRRAPAQVVEELLAGGLDVDDYEVDDLTEDLARFDAAPTMEFEGVLRERNRVQMARYTAWWIDAMMLGADPLRDRMTLFWQGFFTSSFHKVRRSDWIVRQHGKLRGGALGSYADLLREMVRDPAMQVYLDNDKNEKDALNENLARELLELYSLGAGKFRECDVRGVARALTGMEVGADGSVFDSASKHDFGTKLVLGTSGPLDADDVVELLLAQPACAQRLAACLITYFEGVPPAPERGARYAELLRSTRFELKPFLRALFLDPEFYRDEVLGGRVQSPVDYLVGAARRVALPVDPGAVQLAAAELGEELFCPPTVEGWPAGAAWITTSHLMMRGNLCGAFLGVVDLREAFPPEDLEQEQYVVVVPEEPTRLELLSVALSGGLDSRVSLVGRLHAAGLDRDAEIAFVMLDTALAIEPPGDLYRRTTAVLRAERARLGLADGEFLEYAGAEDFLRRLLHGILATPAAQLS